MAHSNSSKTAITIDPEHFPIHCSFTFAKRYAYLVDEIKELTKALPKSEFRFRKEISPYAGICVNIYVKKADYLRPIAQGLKGKDLVIWYLDEDKKITPRDLIEMAQQAQKEVNAGRGK